MQRRQPHQPQEVRSESIATSFSGSLAGGGGCVEVRAGRNSGAGSPNYKMSDHWWGMLIDIPKCIGCGNCVRACQTENDVPDGYFRTWVERYHVDDENMTNPEVISPDGGKEGFPVAKEDAGKYFFVPKMCNHCADSPCTQVCPVGATFVSSRRRGAGGSEVLPRLRLLRAGLPVRMPLHSSGEEGRGQVHALLPPHHQGTDDGVLRELARPARGSWWI